MLKAQMALINFVNGLLRKEEGVTAIEYGLIAALIAVVIIGALSALGVSLQGAFNLISGAISAA